MERVNAIDLLTSGMDITELMGDIVKKIEAVDTSKPMATIELTMMELAVLSLSLRVLRQGASAALSKAFAAAHGGEA